MTGDQDLLGRCGSCARFVRVTEVVQDDGSVRRVGDCLLEAWTSPLSERSTCGDYVLRGTHKAVTSPKRAKSRTATPAIRRIPHQSLPITLTEDLLAMDANEFREVLRDVIREELGLAEVPLAKRWEGGELVLSPGKEGTAEKRIPLDSLFHKIVMIRDKLRVLEQKLNTHPVLTDADKVQLQQYITQCYGSLTTFNILFANKEDGFTGQRSDD